MVGLSVTQAPDDSGWHLSDAFGRLGLTNGGAGNVLSAMISYIENAWRTEMGTEIPLRWRRPLEISLVSPVHLDMIGGESMQVPLLVALLRASASQGKPDALPWEPVPVFSTGRLGGEGQFQPVEGLEQKLLGFLREYGEGLPAILTCAQQQELSRSTNLLGCVNCFTADSVRELLRIPILESALRSIAGPPSPAEIDALAQVIESRRLIQHFGDVTRLASWMLPHVTSAYYRSVLTLQMALMRLHRGDSVKAGEALREVGELVRKEPQHLGVELRIEYMTCLATLSFDSGLPEQGVQALVSLAPEELGAASPKSRTAYWGALCQLYRATGQYEEAINAGQRAVEEALIGRVSEVHIDVNYLAHAFIARARKDQARRQECLLSATQWLSKSTGEYAPPEGSRSRRTHDIFCQHLKAECARLEGRAFGLPAVPKGPLQDWEHAHLFTLLSVARNLAETVSTRNEALTVLLDKSGERVEKAPNQSVFQLFDAVYHVYATYVRQGYARPSTEACRQVLAKLEDAGLKGWRSRLEEPLGRIDDASDFERAVEDLCEAVYFH